MVMIDQQDNPKEGGIEEGGSFETKKNQEKKEKEHRTVSSITVSRGRVFFSESYFFLISL